jgi:hypothetical protein
MSFLSKNQSLFAKISVVVLFLALIRCISEPFRLEYSLGLSLPFEQAKPYLLGGIVAAVSLLVMSFFQWAGWHKAVLIIFAISIAGLLWIKFSYGIK